MATSAARTGVTVDAARARTRRNLYEGMIVYQKNQRPERGVDVVSVKTNVGYKPSGLVQHNRLRIDTHQPVHKKRMWNLGR